MKQNVPDIPTHLMKNPEQYILKSGKFFRKTSIDELYQLVDILSGKMSLVGPRPALYESLLLLIFSLFIIIIDEWDFVIRNSEDQELIHGFLQFLHSLFKFEESKSFLALAYITGILPIKKIRDEALTALIHLGYLAFDSENKIAFIPNYEVACAFDAALQTGE